MIIGKESSSIYRRDHDPLKWPGLPFQDSTRVEAFAASVAEFARLQAATSDGVIEAAQVLAKGALDHPFERLDVSRDFRSFSVSDRSGLSFPGTARVVELSNRNPIPRAALNVNTDAFLSWEYIGGSKSGEKFVYFADGAGNFAKMRQATDYDHGKREIFEQFGSPMVIAGEVKIDWHERDRDLRLMRMGLEGIDSKARRVINPHQS